MERFELTQEQGRQYIGKLFVSGDTARPVLIIRILDVNEEGICLWEQIPTFLIPSERDPNKSLEGIVVCDYVVENNDDDSFPLPAKRMGKLIKLPGSGIFSDYPATFYLKNIPWILTEQGIVHSFIARGCTIGCRTQLGINLGLGPDGKMPRGVPKRKIGYGNIFHDYFNFERKC